MTSSEKFDVLSELDRRGATVKIITVRGEELICKLRGIAEDEADWAYHVVTIENEPRYFTVECNYIAAIEVIK